MSNTPQKALTTPTSSQRVPITPEIMGDIRFVDDAQLSPDGQRIAYVVQEQQPKQREPRSHIWLAEASGGEPEPLLDGRKHSTSPRWSPDGKWLAFLSKEEGEQGQSQLYLMPAGGGEARQGCSMPNGISEIAWSPDSSRIAFLSLAGKEPQNDPKVFPPDKSRHQRLWMVRPDYTLPEAVTPDGITVWEYTWSPDSKHLGLYYAHEPEETGWYHSQIGVVPATGGAIRQVTQFTPVSVQARALTWSPDGQHLAYVSGRWSDPGRGAGDIFLLSLQSGEARNLTPRIECSPTWCAWFPDGQRLLYTAVAGVSHQIGILDTVSGATTLLEHDFVMQWDQPTLSLSSDLTRFATVHSTPQQPPDVHVGTLEQEDSKAASITWQRITRINPIPEETWTLTSSLRIQYASADGARVHAIFTAPVSDKRGTPPPLFVDVHGGPSGAYCDHWTLRYAQILASAGYAVLRVNYRGSWGNGAAFADAVMGDVGGKDLQDILAGIDYVIAQGWADGERLAIGGWSNGGFLAAWAVTQSTRFKAAVMGAGISDWLNMHAQTNIPDADVLQLIVDPLEQPDVYHQHSPITFAKRVTTPTLILHGETDPGVPVAQAYAFYRALCERHVPVEMAIYPREGHGLSEPEHGIDADNRVLRWLERYV
ncbi:MAG: S9 family peptidase [Ktedonobacteraceae bacterium]